jgi:hypothetical protein
MRLACAGLLAARMNESFPAQRGQVRANSVLGERKLLGQLGDRPGAAAQKLHNLASSGLEEFFARCACRHRPFSPCCRAAGGIEIRVVFVKRAINTTKH